MSDFVLDASAVLTVINEEPGSDQLEPHLKTGCISSVNLAEIVPLEQSTPLEFTHHSAGIARA